MWHGDVTFFFELIVLYADDNASEVLVGFWNPVVDWNDRLGVDVGVDAAIASQQDVAEEVCSHHG